MPRDREGSFELQIIGRAYLVEMYGTEVAAEFISKVTDEVAAEITAWQNRPLEAMYPVVFFDALRVKIRDGAVVRNRAVYLALDVPPDGTGDVLGIWGVRPWRVGSGISGQRS